MSGSPTAPPPSAPEASPDELVRLGVTRVQTEHFQVGNYRYSSLADAIAEARRIGNGR